MIQRIQTLYLLLVVILSGVTLFLPVATWVSEVNTWPLSLMSGLIAGVAIGTVFLFKRRPLQIRLNILNMMLIVVYYGLFFFYLWSSKSQYSVEVSLHTVVIFPLLSLILTYLAIQSIRKDEAKVRSLDRLR